MKINYRKTKKYTLGGCLVFLLLVLAFIAIGYGISLALVGIGMWALCKLGVIAAWTWKEAALWTIVIEIGLSFLCSVVNRIKSKD